MCARVLVWVRLGLDLGFAFFWGGLDAKTFGRHTSTLETLKKTIAQTFEKQKKLLVDAARTVHVYTMGNRYAEISK